jgi:branched-chain amino acid transport system substrate-binding protein
LRNIGREEKMKNKHILTVIFALIIGIAFTAPLTAHFAKGQFAGQIKIGVIGPQGLPHWSPGMKEAAEMARDEINAAGGVHLGDGDYEIVLAFANEYAYPTPDPPAAASEMERLISEEGCEFIIGGFRTECTASMVEVAADFGVPFIIDGASTNELISETVGTNYERYKYLFRVMPVNSTQLVMTLAGAIQYIIPTFYLPLYGRLLWEGAPNPQVRVAVLTEDLEWTLQIHALLTNPAYYPSLLGPYANVTYSGRIPDGTTDCTPWLQGVIDSGARIMIHIFSGVTGVPLIVQWTAMNVKAVPIGINVLAQLQTHWNTTGGQCQYETVLNPTGTRTPIVPGKTEVFWDNFVAKTGAWPIYTAFGAYDSVYMLKETIEAIGTKDKDAIVAHWEDPAFERLGLINRFKFASHDVFTNEPGPFWTQNFTRAMFVQWQRGRMEVVSPANMPYSKPFALPPSMKALVTDMNYDGKIDIVDISRAALAFGTKPGDARWNIEADIDGNSNVNIVDLTKIAKDWKMSVPLPLD